MLDGMWKDFLEETVFNPNRGRASRTQAGGAGRFSAETAVICTGVDTGAVSVCAGEAGGGLRVVCH